MAWTELCIIYGESLHSFVPGPRVVFFFFSVLFLFFNTQIRRKAGQDQSTAREELEAKQRTKEALQKQRERQADIEAKKRVREQIEADKRERAERARIEKARRAGNLDEAATLASGGKALPATSASGSGTGAATAAPPAAASNRAASANTARLRVRLNNGQTWQGTLPADATLAQVEGQILEAGVSSGPRLSLSTTFPRKTFSEAEKASTLRDLGLVPNAALEGHAVP